MKFCVLGAGGREHAIAWALQRSGHDVVALPGNPGIASVAELLPGSLDDLDDVVALALQSEVDVVVVGPEAPLANGIVDRAQAAGLSAFGPCSNAARIEASKAYAKEVMIRASVPTARSATAMDLDTALVAVRAAGAPCVVKADGLAAGKGVVIAADLGQAEQAVRDCFGGRFGGAGNAVVIEECLEGEELSLLVLCDGRTAVPLPVAQDHKPIGESDTGPNTGGMGAYSPVPSGTPALVGRIMDEIVEPTLWSLSKDAVVYTGILYCGLMLTDAGPMVLEYNCRFGDPEAQAVIPRLVGDFGELLAATARGGLDPQMVSVLPEEAVAVVASAAGYPNDAQKGDRIGGLEEAAALSGALVFHAGTAVVDRNIVTAGGRVLAVTGLGEDLSAARDTAYKALDLIHWDGKYERRDIGYRALGGR